MKIVGTAPRRILPAAILTAGLLLAGAAAAQETTFLGAWQWLYTRLEDGTLVPPSPAGCTVQLQFLAGDGAGAGPFTRLHDRVAVHAGDWFLGHIYLYFQGGLVCVTTLETSAFDTWIGWQRDGQTLRLMRGTLDGPQTEDVFTYLGPVPAASRSWGGLQGLYRTD